MKRHDNLIEDAHNYSQYGPKMKKNEELQNEIHLALIHPPFFNNRETGIYARLGKYMKTFLYMIFFTGIAVVFTSCVGGYVITEPSYGYYERPPRPSETHIWISGDWRWDSHSSVYVQKAGYWEKPRQYQTYHEGYWQSTPNGKSWNKGHWQKNNNTRNNSNNRVRR